MFCEYFCSHYHCLSLGPYYLAWVRIEQPFYSLCSLPLTCLPSATFRVIFLKYRSSRNFWWFLLSWVWCWNLLAWHSGPFEICFSIWLFFLPLLLLTCQYSSSPRIYSCIYECMVFFLIPLNFHSFLCMRFPPLSSSAFPDNLNLQDPVQVSYPLGSFPGSTRQNLRLLS